MEIVIIFRQHAALLKCPLKMVIFALSPPRNFQKVDRYAVAEQAGLSLIWLHNSAYRFSHDMP